MVTVQTRVTIEPLYVILNFFNYFNGLGPFLDEYIFNFARIPRAYIEIKSVIQ